MVQFEVGREFFDVLQPSFSRLWVALDDFGHQPGKETDWRG